MSATNRQVIRERIAAYLQTDLVGVGKPAAAVYSYQKKKFDASPVVMVMSDGSARGKKGIGTKKYRDVFSFQVHTYIRDTDDTGLDDQARENLNDLIDQMIADCIANHESDSLWDRLYFAGDDASNSQPTKSKARKVSIDGKAYLFELHNVEVLTNE